MRGAKPEIGDEPIADIESPPARRRGSKPPPDRQSEASLSSPPARRRGSKPIPPEGVLDQHASQPARRRGSTQTTTAADTKNPRWPPSSGHETRHTLGQF